jgi:tetratricopeptide (TPR) repeat protein
MRQEDSYGLAITTTSDLAASHFRTAVDLSLAAWPGADVALDAALKADPRLSLAWAARARIHQMEGARAKASETIARARGLADSEVSDRERSHVDVIALGVEGKPAESLEHALVHLQTWPRDAVILSLPLGAFGLFAFSGMAAHDQARVDLCERYRREHDEHWWFQTSYGWALVENNTPVEGRRLIETSFETKPDNANSAHALAHAMYEQGAAREADAMIEAWLPGYDRTGILHAHLAWHQALTALEQGEAARATAIYSELVRPRVSAALTVNMVSDAAAFLWRLGLNGIDPAPELWSEAIEVANGAYPHAGFAFIDIHMGMVAAAAGDGAALERRVAALDARIQAGQYRAGPVGPATCQALFAFAEQRYEDCAGLLERVAHDVVRIGGSHAQRDVIEETLLVAWMRSGQAEKARGLLDARLHRRPSARDSQWRASLPA